MSHCARYDLDMTWTDSHEALIQGPASRALSAWAGLVRSVRAASSAGRLEEAREAVAAVLWPAQAVSVRRGAAIILAEQMTTDVSALLPDQRAAAMAELGASALPFVQATWVCDMSLRARNAFDALFGDGLVEDAMSDGPVAEDPPWPAQELFLREVAMMTTLDPVTSEVVRLRGAHAHGCRLCQSLRSRRAVEAAGGEGFFEPLAGNFDAAVGLSPGHATAIRVVDTFVWQPMAWPDDLADAVRATFSADQAVEMVLDIVRNAANKIAVAFGADEPHVSEGVEYYDIDFTNGELMYGLPPA